MHGASNLSVRLLELGEVDAYLDLTVVVDAGSGVDAAIEWSKHEPGIAWIDLEVFSDNPAAQALYMRHGFRCSVAHPTASGSTATRSRTSR